jgi:hypothetical protein
MLDNAPVAPVILDRLLAVAVTAIAIVLVLAAVGKLRRPDRAGARGLAIVELAAAALVLLAPGRLGDGAVAALFAGFAWVHARTPERDCGCLGDEPGASRPRAVTMTIVPAALAALAAVDGPAGALQLGRSRPGAAVLVVSLAAASALVWTLAFRGRPAGLASAGERLVVGASGFLERRLSRRSAIARLALTGSALAVAPVRYLLYPGDALAAIVPGDCGGGACTDGYTAFCCEINQGVNACPAGTFAGGWWMCTDYAGRRLCSDQGVRYYVDCNRIPGTHFPGGCKCANDNCNERRVACNVFRYGQCNTQVPGVTEVVCRMVLCENPARVPELHCSSSLAVDNAVCGHDAPCLEPAALELSGAGGV